MVVCTFLKDRHEHAIVLGLIAVIQTFFKINEMGCGDKTELIIRYATLLFANKRYCHIYFFRFIFLDLFFGFIF